MRAVQWEACMDGWVSSKLVGTALNDPSTTQGIASKAATADCPLAAALSLALLGGGTCAHTERQQSMHACTWAMQAKEVCVHP